MRNTERVRRTVGAKADMASDLAVNGDGYVPRPSILFAVAFVGVTGGYVVGDERLGAVGTALILVSGCAAAVALVGKQESLMPAKRWLSLVPVLALAAVSLGWSHAPEASIDALARTGFIIVAGGLLGMLVPLEAQARSVLLCGVLWAVAAMALIAFSIPGAIDADSRDVAWRGLFVNKNSLGRALSLAAVACLVLMASSNGKSRRWILPLIVCIGVMFQAHSASGIAVAALAGVGLLVTQARFAFRRLVPGVTVLVYLLGSATAQRLGDLASYLGRDGTLTGRVPLWELILQYADLAPWLGYGYGAFWSTSAGAVVTHASGFAVGQAHSGLIEMRLALGWVGVVLFSIVLWVASRVGAVSRGAGPTWLMVLVIWIVFSDMTEATSLSGLALFLLSAGLASRLDLEPAKEGSV